VSFARPAPGEVDGETPYGYGGLSVLVGYSVVKDGSLHGLFPMRQLLTEALPHRITIEASQHAPELIEVLAPRHECCSTAAVLRNRALKVRLGIAC
jgi:hypothetical protein